MSDEQGKDGKDLDVKKKKTPGEWQKFWNIQFAFSKKKLKKWQKDGDQINDRFLGKSYADDDTGLAETQLNLFHANVTTLQSMLYGQIPKVEIDRTFSDANDDVARVAGEMATRMLNQDIQDAGEDYATTLRSVLQDRLIPGMGNARVVYGYRSEKEQTPPVMDDKGVEIGPAVEKDVIKEEWVDEVYIHWKDQLWSPCRIYSEMWWWAHRSFMKKDELIERFGDGKDNKLIESIPMNSKGPMNSRRQSDDNDTIAEAEVWEIWNKNTGTVFWYVEGMQTILEEKDDYLELDEFFPAPPPLIANVTTSEFIARADYTLAQDLYREIDELETRITLLTRACKAVGVYDKSATAVARMLTEGVENTLIPADNWAMFAEKGGITGAIDWLPIKDVAEVVQILSGKQAEKIQQLYQVTGIADILNGQSQPYEAAATSKAKAQFASIKVQALQEEFARFASDLQSKKLQIIQKHFQPECILYQSNIQQSMDGQDPQIIQQAIALLKDRTKARWRVKIRPETLAMADYAQLKVDRGEYITALSTFMQSSAPLAQLDADIVPTLLQLLQWGLAGFKGSNQIEGVLDKAIAEFRKKAEAQKAQPPKPSPEEMKQKTEMMKIQAKSEADKAEAQTKFQLDQQKAQQEMQQDQMKFQQEMRQGQEEFAMRMQEMQLEFSLKMKQLLMEVGARKEEVQDDKEEREHEAAVGMETREHELAVAKAMPKEEGAPRSNE